VQEEFGFLTLEDTGTVILQVVRNYCPVTHIASLKAELVRATVIATVPAGCVMVPSHLICICFSLTVFFSRARKVRCKRLVLRVFSERTLIMEQYSKVQ